VSYPLGCSPTSSFSCVSDLAPALQTIQLTDLLHDLQAKEARKAERAFSFTCNETLCADHNEPCNLYCKSCGILICAHCIVTTHQNPSHDYCTTKEAFESCKAELTTCLISADECVQKLKAALLDLDLHQKLVEEHKGEIQKEIKVKIQSLHEALDKREAKLLDELEVIVTHKTRSIQVDKNKLQSRLEPLQAAFVNVKVL